MKAMNLIQRMLIMVTQSPLEYTKKQLTEMVLRSLNSNRKGDSIFSR